MSGDIPWERVAEGRPLKMAKPTMLVDLRRCIGCHACSVACKVEHDVPLGDFRMRVRWLPRPDRPGISFLPLFDEASCTFCEERQDVGLKPSCTAACPTQALVFGDADDASSSLAQTAARDGAQPLISGAPTKKDVVYVGLESWHPSKVNAGVALSPEDEDITYEQ